MTITDRLRESYTPGQERRPEVDNEAADVIDALVAALEASKWVDWDRLTVRETRLLDKQIAAALSKAKGKT